MGRSLRRIKKSKPRIVKRKKKTSFSKSQKPLEIARKSTDLEAKLGIGPTWEENEKMGRNYEKLGLAADVNSRRGRNSRSASIDAKVAAVDDPVLDEDLAAAMGHMRSSGKAPPQRPTPRQRTIVQRLTDAHGDDVDAMTKDIKLNAMQHSKGQLIKLIESCKYWSQKGNVGVEFRVPTKRLW